MNKSELIKAAAAKAEVSAALAAKVIDAALDEAVAAVKRGEGVQLIGIASIGIAQKQLARLKTRVLVRSLTFRQRRSFVSNRVQDLLSN